MMVYNVDTGKLEALKLLRLNQIDKYNNGIGDSNVAGQLRGVYWLDRWVRNKKMVVVNSVLVYGCTTDKCIQIESADVKGGSRETLVQRAVLVSKGNFRILD